MENNFFFLIEQSTKGFERTKRNKYQPWHVSGPPLNPTPEEQHMENPKKKKKKSRKEPGEEMHKME